MSSDPLSLKGAKGKAGAATITLCAETPETPRSPGGRGGHGVTEAWRGRVTCPGLHGAKGV